MMDWCLGDLSFRIWAFVRRGIRRNIYCFSMYLEPHVFWFTFDVCGCVCLAVVYSVVYRGVWGVLWAKEGWMGGI